MSMLEAEHNNANLLDLFATAQTRTTHVGLMDVPVLNDLGNEQDEEIAGR